MSPISLAILNPVSFVLMEIGKLRDRRSVENSINGDLVEVRSRGRTQLKLVASVAKNIVLNPIILMTVLGIVGNLIFKHKVPVCLKGILEVN